jgi:tetratricopeptide (TPR) repeat protein
MERTSDPAETRVVQYSRWLEQHPDDARARHHRGHAFHLLKRYAEAIEDFETAMRLHPEDAHYSRELAAFRDEAARVLAAPPGELPVNVFAPAR